MTWTKLQKIAGVLLVLQGAGHTLIGTSISYHAVSQDAVWFAGAGLAMCFLGLQNLGPWDSAPVWFRRSTILGNGLWTVLMLALLVTSQSIRVISAAAIAGASLACSVGRWRQDGSAP